MRKILVTGGNGQLGQCLKNAAEALDKHRYQFIFVNRQQLDITQAEAIQSFLEDNAIDCLVNCAAYTAVDRAEKEKELAYAVNADAVKTLALETHKRGITFIHISTDYVFGGHGNKPFKENDATSPINVYGQSKLQGEELALAHNPNAVIIRTAWVYSQYGHNFLKTMLRLFKDKEQISVVNDQLGTPTNANDIAAAIIKIILTNSKPTGVYHYTNAGQTSWHGFAEKIKEFTQAQIQIEPIATKDYPTPAQRPLYSVLDTHKIKQTFGVEVPQWEESLKKLMEKMI